MHKLQTYFLKIKKMILPDKLIKKEIEFGNIKMFPMPEKIEGSSVDLTLSNKFKRLKSPMIDIKDKDTFEYEDFEADEVIFSPGEFLLGSTIERIELSPKISAFVAGRSSFARLGFSVENSGFFDAGFCGTATLELCNISNRPIKIHSGTKICQIIFVRMEDEPDVPYGKKTTAKYQNQVLPEGSKIYEEK